MQIRAFSISLLAAACAAALALTLALTASGSARTQASQRVPAAAGVPLIPIGSAHPSSSNGTLIDPPTCVPPSGVHVTCYSPQLIEQAYDFPTGGGAPTGRGQTIMIVEAYGNPTVTSDLATFDREWHLPAPPAFDVIGPNGTGDSSDPNVLEWQRETSLDVEWAHALAPGARIVLVVASSDDDLVMNAAEQDALPQYPGAIVSHSFGSPETDDVPGNTALHQIFVQAQHLGDTLVAGAGDFGATDGTDTAMASYPASDPLVTSVGGTEGLPYPDGLWRSGGFGGFSRGGNAQPQPFHSGSGSPVTPGRDNGGSPSPQGFPRRGGYGAEQVWNEGDILDVATGGAPSVLFDAPSWQQPFSHSSARTVPDVAFDAAVDGGVLIVTGGQVSLMGGTSLGSPAWAAIFARANESRGRQPLEFATPSLYALAANPRTYRQDFHDITVGNNALDSPIGFDAGPGYDLTTGLGTPDVANLLGDLGRSHSGPGFDTGNPYDRGNDHHGGFQGGHGRWPGR